MPDEPADLSSLLGGQEIDQESLFGLVASLANLLDKELVVETIASVLGIQPVHDGNCVFFDDLAICFGDDGKVKSVFRTIDGSHLSAE